MSQRTMHIQLGHCVPSQYREAMCLGQNRAKKFQAASLAKLGTI